MICFKTTLDVGRVAVGIDERTKEGVLSAAVRLLCSSRGGDAERLLEEVRRREALGSTGIGEGVAVPHALWDGVEGTSMAALRLATPVEFGAPDGRPVDLVFLMVGPRRDRSSHLTILSKLARVLHDPAFRVAARSAPDAAALCALVYGRD